MTRRDSCNICGESCCGDEPSCYLCDRDFCDSCFVGGIKYIEDKYEDIFYLCQECAQMHKTYEKFQKINVNTNEEKLLDIIMENLTNKTSEQLYFILLQMETIVPNKHMLPNLEQLCKNIKNDKYHIQNDDDHQREGDEEEGEEDEQSYEEEVDDDENVNNQINDDEEA